MQITSCKYLLFVSAFSHLCCSFFVQKGMPNSMTCFFPPGPGVLQRRYASRCNRWTWSRSSSTSGSTSKAPNEITSEAPTPRWVTMMSLNPPTWKLILTMGENFGELKERPFEKGSEWESRIFFWIFLHLVVFVGTVSFKVNKLAKIETFLVA